MTPAGVQKIKEEIIALESILLKDCIISTQDDVPKVIEIVVHPLTGEHVDQQYVCVTLEVRFTIDYPDNSPEIVLRNPRGLDDGVLASINSQINNKLIDCLGQPVVYEVFQLIRENLTKSNLPSGRCAICLFEFAQGDVFTKTQCYHHFHNHCLGDHLMTGKKFHQEEFDSLPFWQQLQAPPYQQSCPVCRCAVNFDVDWLKSAPQPLKLISAPPFELTDELRAVQAKMASLLLQQKDKGGVVTSGDMGPPPLMITTAADRANQAAAAAASASNHGAKNEASQRGAKNEASQHGAKNEASQHGAKNEASQHGAKNEASQHGAKNKAQPSSSDNAAPSSPQTQQGYRGPYRGFNRRGKPGRRGRGAAGSR